MLLNNAQLVGFPEEVSDFSGEREILNLWGCRKSQTPNSLRVIKVREPSKYTLKRISCPKSVSLPHCPTPMSPKMLSLTQLLWPSAQSPSQLFSQVLGQARVPGWEPPDSLGGLPHHRHHLLQAPQHKEFRKHCTEWSLSWSLCLQRTTLKNWKKSYNHLVHPSIPFIEMRICRVSKFVVFIQRKKSIHCVPETVLCLGIQQCMGQKKSLLSQS